ncbi:MAG: baseplate J/gp47 family protein [Sphingomonas sp.]
MSGKPDGRSQETVRAQLVRRAAALLGPDGAPVAPGTIETAVIAAAARMIEEVTRRLDKVPGKQADNFYAAMGIGRDPALPARVPVAIKLTDTAPGGLVAPAGTKLTADTGATPTIFETERGIALVRGKVATLAAADLAADAIYLAPSGVAAPVLPAPAAVTRNVRSAAGAGATMVQVDPAPGLAKGMTIRFTANDTREYDITEIKNDVVSFTPALAGTIAKGDQLFVVDHFVPFAGSRDRQSHALYLSHPTMLDVAGALTITVAGVEPGGQAMTWEWFAQGADGAPADWREFDARFDTDRWALQKPQGKPEKTTVNGRNALWIRGRLDGSSSGSSLATNITMAVSSGGLCARAHDERCTAASGAALPAVDYDAVAVTTPVVPNKPYYPFGREPRLYDAFYIGCAEAFGKAGAEVSLCLSLGGASLERIVAAAGRESTYLFGLGTDHQLYAARFGNAMPTFSVVPGPHDGDRLAELPDLPHLSARIDGERVRIAIGGIGAVYVTQFPVGTPLVEGAISWLKLATAPEDAARPVGPLVAGGDGDGSIHAMVGTRLLSWRHDATGSLALQKPEEAHDLIPVQGRDAALLIVDEGGQWRVRVKPGTATATVDGALLAPGDLPAANRAAWAPPGDGIAGDHFHVAGYDDATPAGGEAKLQLVTLDSNGAGAIVAVGSCPPLPITFEPPVGAGDGSPVIVVAAAKPTRFIRRGGDFEATGGVEGIGDGANPVRQIIFAGDRAMTQHWDRGLLYRAAPGDRLMQPIAVDGAQRQVADDRDVPADAVYFVDKDEDNGGGNLIANSSGDRLLLPLTADATASSAVRSGSFLKQGGETGALDEDGGLITLTDQSGPESTAQHDVDLFLSIAGQPIGIWHLRYDSDEAGWTLPAGSPDLPSHPPGTGIAYQLLDRLADADLQLQDYFQLEPRDAFMLSRMLAAGPLRSFYNDVAVTQVEHFGSYPAIRLDHDLIDDQVAVLAMAATGWTTLGPSEPANPALSWEYWNGASWWALDTDTFGFSDRTANLQISQGIFFKAPPNLAETEVGGRKNLWIRARLVGGDYGEAKVVITSIGNGKKTDQTMTRDLSAIRAPYVIGLKINYCVTEPVKPAIVVTADNLGTVDQTNANDAGLPVTIFPTVAQALASQAPAGPEANAIPNCCRDVPAGTDTAAPEGEGDASTTASRALLIGFDQPIDQSPLSLFIDAVANGDWAIEAAMFRAGRFEAARVLTDDSSGLGESGVIAIEIARPPDRVALFGTSAYWLRLTPTGDTAGSWSPQLRGVYLNGVVAASVETRAIETIGTSSGAPDQQFQLFATPIDPDSLILRVAEPVGEDEALTLGAAPEIAGMPGPWVAWTRVNEFPAEGAADPDRLFTIDAERGVVGFGDGRTALVPPMGGAVLALAYHRVAGAAANAVSAGAKLQPVSPIAGIDQVIALDGAAGGADVEAPESARSRAPAKLANGGRVVTLADIENHVLARDPTIVQARAENRQGGTRLVVVGAGARPIPPPSARRAILRALESVASFGTITRLTVIGPRLLPIAVTLAVEPDPGVDFVGVEEEAAAAILALCDPEGGGFDGRGWPVGVLPTIDDIAAALAPLGDRAVIGDIAIGRSEPHRAMPDPFPSDVLIRIERADIAVRAYAEAAG